MQAAKTAGADLVEVRIHSLSDSERPQYQLQSTFVKEVREIFR